MFTATTPDERDEWISAVKENVAVLKPPEATPAAPAAEVKAEAATAGSPAPAAAPTPAASDFSDPIEIGYWKIRGLGAPLRQMCVYVVPSRISNVEINSCTHVHSLTLVLFHLLTRDLSLSVSHTHLTRASYPPPFFCAL